MPFKLIRRPKADLVSASLSEKWNTPSFAISLDRRAFEIDGHPARQPSSLLLPGGRQVKFPELLAKGPPKVALS